VIALLKEELRVLEPEMEFGDSTHRSVQKEVLEEAVKTEKSCGFKTNELCMFAGIAQGDEQALEFVQEELNLKSVQINGEIARSQEEMKTKESNQNIGAEREGPADDWSRTGEGIENCVKFPSSTPNEIVELYRKLDLQRRELERQRTYAQNNLLKKQDKKVFMNDSHEAEDGEKKRLVDNLMVNANQHTDVLTKELERNLEHHIEVLPEEADEEASEDFLSTEEGLELRRENLMTELTSETIGSCDFEADNLIVYTGNAEDSPSLGIVLEEEELLQKEGETMMSHKQRLVTTGDKKELAYLYSQEKTVGQNFGTATVIENEATVFEELDLISRINQNDDQQLQKIVEREDEGYAGNNLQHVDEMLEEKWLKCLLETFEPEKEVADKFAGNEQKNVAEGQEVWEIATSMVAAEATCGVTSAEVKPMLSTIGEMTAETTLAAATGSESSSSRLDIEIEIIRRLMMKVSPKQQIAARKKKNFSKRKTEKDCESIVSGAMQHKVWKPGKEQQTEAVTNGKLQHKIWDPGIPRSEHMIRR